MTISNITSWSPWKHIYCAYLDIRTSSIDPITPSLLKSATGNWSLHAAMDDHRTARPSRNEQNEVAASMSLLIRSKIYTEAITSQKR